MQRKVVRGIGKMELMTGIKKIIFRIFKFILYMTLTAIVLLCLLVVLLFFDEPGHCLDTQHGVWDYAENRCRMDCYKWTSKYGCIQMTPEHRKFIDECYEDWQHCDKELAHKYYLELCEKYKVPIDPKTGECYFD